MQRGISTTNAIAKEIKAGLVMSIQGLAQFSFRSNGTQKTNKVDHGAKLLA